MKKLGIALGAIAVSLVAAAVALGAVTNVYGVTASTSPTTAGSATKPVPVQLKFAYTVDEASGKRPSAVKTYKIGLAGIAVNVKGFKKCTAQQINATGSPASDSVAKCPTAALMGTGFADNTVGQSASETDQSLHCYLNLKIYNAGVQGGKQHAALYLYGTTRPDGQVSQAGDKYCVINFGYAIDAVYVNKNGGSSLEFTVPPTVLHNVPGTTTAVRKVQSTILKKTVGSGAKRHAYYSSVGGCKAKKRKVTVTFVTESGQTSVARTTAPCK